MLNTVRSRRGMVTSPHHLASEAGLRVLRDGGTAIEATVAMAAALAVVYPHMTGIGGDGFWLVAAPGRDPVGIDACGAAGSGASPELYVRHGLTGIPWRGPLAANTAAGTVAGWHEALTLNAELGGELPLARLLEDAIWHAQSGFPVTQSQVDLTTEKFAELKDVRGFAETFLPGGVPPRSGDLMRLPLLARTLQMLAADGCRSFYEGALAQSIGRDLAEIGAPVGPQDLSATRAQRVRPLTVAVREAMLFNMPPPTQGLAALMILALFDRLGVHSADGFEHVHGLVEATKQAFLVRDAEVGCPSTLSGDPQRFLAADALDRLAARIDRTRALPWPVPMDAKGDTVWLGAIDGNGVAASFIQSVYFEFGSGCVLPRTGITWQNRGASFALTGPPLRLLRPGAKPFHTLNPALARFPDGGTMVYGTMGGEGQPQTQAAVFSRIHMFGQDLQQAITAPRWLLGRTWGAQSVTLKLESRFAPELIHAMRAAGHDVEVLGPFTSTMGHAGAIRALPSGVIEGATDPRSDGAALGF